MKKTAVYARFSSDNQRKESIDEQVRACKYFAQQTGQYDIVKIYSDEALSGFKRTHKREGFLRLIEDARSHKFECVMVYELSRFSRNGTDTITYTKELERLGIEFVSVRERLDRTPEGRMMMYVITGMNEYYSRNLAIEVMRGLKENAYNAKHTGGTPPLGYDVDKNGKYIINPTEAAAVRLIFDMYLSGSGYTAIVEELNSRGYRTKRGSKFVRNSLYDLLRNEKYRGDFIYNRTASLKGGKHNRHAYKDEADVIRVENAFPAIITKEEYKEVLRCMKENEHKGTKNAAVHDYLLSGKVYCGECGKSMYGETRFRSGHNYSYYCCNGHKSKICTKRAIRCDKLEDEVIEQLNKMFFTPQLIDNIAERLHDENNNSKADELSNILRKESADLKRKIDNGTKVILDGVDSDELREAVKELSARKKVVDQSILNIEAAAYHKDKSVEEIKKAFGEFANINILTREQQKQIIQKFVWRIYVYDSPNPNDGDKIKIVLAQQNRQEQSLKIWQAITFQ